MNFHDLVGDVHDPVLAKAGGGIERPLHLAIFAERGDGNFNDEQGFRRVLATVVPEWNYGDVGLGLGVVVGDERRLDPNDCTPDKGGSQNHGQPINGTHMLGVVRTHVDEHSVEQLDALVLECAEGDQAIVFDALEWPWAFRKEQRSIEHIDKVAHTKMHRDSSPDGKPVRRFL